MPILPVVGLVDERRNRRGHAPIMIRSATSADTRVCRRIRSTPTGGAAAPALRVATFRELHDVRLRAMSQGAS